MNDLTIVTYFLSLQKFSSCLPIFLQIMIDKIVFTFFPQLPLYPLSLFPPFLSCFCFSFLFYGLISDLAIFFPILQISSSVSSNSSSTKATKMKKNLKKLMKKLNSTKTTKMKKNLKKLMKKFANRKKRLPHRKWRRQ